jgi:N-acetylglucosamine kinase-like BadF-type ATPase
VKEDKDRAALGLGIDAGGTQTRWALATTSGEVIASGHVEGLTALQMSSAAGRERMSRTFSEIAAATAKAGRATYVVAGMTGFDEGSERSELAALIAAPLGIDASAVTISGDMEIAYLDVFAPGEGYLVYAGTGSIAAFMDERRELHRVGGHGGILDDAGSGFWIAARALRHVLRAEDEQPGAWRTSPMATAIFELLGGSEWPRTREFVYAGGFEANRGKVGRLALGVAKAADADPAAAEILRSAGEELARLGRVLIQRFGPRPIALAGRVVELHPLIERSLRAGLPEGTRLVVRGGEAHHAAARIAARS